jgi:epoxyqueuosine reductase
MLSAKIRELAKTAGIDELGFTNATEFCGYPVAGSRRRDPLLSLPEARSIIIAGIYIGGLKLPFWADPLFGRTSRLYLSGYFADVVEPLEPIKSFLTQQGYRALICESIESERSILPLKLAAIRAGFGWQGKNSLLVTRKYGTFLALGGIITNAVLEYSERTEPNRCGTCKKCQEACPVSSLDHPFVLDKFKCIAYQLQQEQLSDEARMTAENRVGDCEICQEVCPWNKKNLEDSLPTKLTLTFQQEISKWEKVFWLPDLVNLSEKEYQRIFGPLKTDIPYMVFHRNVSIALERARKIIKSE